MKIKFLVFHAEVAYLLVKTFSFMNSYVYHLATTACSITDIDEARVIFFYLWLQMTHDFGTLIWKHVGTKNFSLKLKIRS